jgi:hypothetical protein
MTEPDPTDSPAAPSEKTKNDAASPSAGVRPDSPASQKPPLIRAVDVPLYAVPGTKSIRPPTYGSPQLSPKQSSAPAPRLRPVAPLESAEGAGMVSQPLLSDAEISATQEIAEAVSSAHWSGSDRAYDHSANISGPLAGVLPIGPRSRATGADSQSFRRTVIPILLTSGVILAGAGALLRFGGEDNALSDLFPDWVPIVFGVLALVCFVIAALNMAAVRNAEMRREGAK